jgi:DNA-binding XRE family transcriptional regulator
MKNFIFRKDQNGFRDWITSIDKMRMYISAYKKGATWIKDTEYTEANWWYVNYLEYMKGLIEEQKEFIRVKEKGHIPEWSCCNGFDIEFMFERWLEIVASFKLNQLEEISCQEVGDSIKRARKDRNMNRAQVADILGIGADTLKSYEEGKRKLPFEIYYKLIQLFEFDIGIIKTKF